MCICQFGVSANQIAASTLDNRFMATALTYIRTSVKG